MNAIIAELSLRPTDVLFTFEDLSGDISAATQKEWKIFSRDLIVDGRSEVGAARKRSGRENWHVDDNFSNISI